jgi:hypothetical protein
LQVSKLESEAEQLHADFVQSQQNVKALERRLAGMESELVEQQQRVRPTIICFCLRAVLLQPHCMLYLSYDRVDLLKKRDTVNGFLMWQPVCCSHAGTAVHDGAAQTCCREKRAD